MRRSINASSEQNNRAEHPSDQIAKYTSDHLSKRAGIRRTIGVIKTSGIEARKSPQTRIEATSHPSIQASKQPSLRAGQATKSPSGRAFERSASSKRASALSKQNYGNDRAWKRPSIQLSKRPSIEVRACPCPSYQHHEVSSVEFSKSINAVPSTCRRWSLGAWISMNRAKKSRDAHFRIGTSIE